MKAVRLEGTALRIKDLPSPVPGVEEALVRITAAGVCHSDLHLARGDWSGHAAIDVIGHEAHRRGRGAGPGAERYTSVSAIGSFSVSAGPAAATGAAPATIACAASRDFARRRRASWAPSPRFLRVGARAGQAAGRAGRPRGAARVRRAHCVTAR